MNRFGHCLSLKEINHVETCLAEEQVNNNQRNFVPNNIQPGLIITFVYDNVNHNLESIRGLTTYATNGIIIQRVIYTSNEPQQSSSALKSKRLKNNSFKPIDNELAPYLKIKTRKNLQTISDIKQNTNNLIPNIAKNQDKV